MSATINVRPWLYRIARNRSLNHLRRASAIGVDSMDVHFAEHGLSTGDRVIRRESFRELIADVQELPETQRTALLLREIDALSYEQIAHAMETTVPSVKSLLVRARISLAEAAEARKLSCEEVRLELGEVAEGLTKLSTPARRHVRDCERCGFFKKQLKHNNHALAAIFPVGPLLLFKKLLLAKLGSASGAHVAGGAARRRAAPARRWAPAPPPARSGRGASVAGGILTAGAGALATKAVAGLAAAAIVTAGRRRRRPPERSPSSPSRRWRPRAPTPTRAAQAEPRGRPRASPAGELRRTRRSPPRRAAPPRAIAAAKAGQAPPRPPRPAARRPARGGDRRARHAGRRHDQTSCRPNQPPRPRPREVTSETTQLPADGDQPADAAAAPPPAEPTTDRPANHAVARPPAEPADRRTRAPASNARRPPPSAGAGQAGNGRHAGRLRQPKPRRRRRRTRRRRRRLQAPPAGALPA